MARKFGTTLTEHTVVKLYGCELDFRFKTKESSDWLKQLESMGLAMDDLEPVFAEFGKYLVDESIPATFAAKGRPKRWARLSPRYAMMRFGRRDVIATLVLSGKMKAGFRYEAHPRSMRIINRRFYWTYHQFGAPRAHLPARPMLVLMRQDKSRFLDIAHKHVFGTERAR